MLSDGFSIAVKPEPFTGGRTEKEPLFSFEGRPPEVKCRVAEFFGWHVSRLDRYSTYIVPPFGNGLSSYFLPPFFGVYVSALFFYSSAAVFFLSSSHNHRRRRPTNPARPIFFYSTPRWFFHSPPPPPPLSPLLLLRRGRVVVACWAARDSTISILFCIVAQLSQQRRGAESGPFLRCLVKFAPKGRRL